MVMIRLFLFALLAFPLAGYRHEFPGRFVKCGRCAPRVDYVITYDFGPTQYPDEIRWIAFRCSDCVNGE